MNQWINNFATFPPPVEVLLKLTVLLALAWTCKLLVSQANSRWQVFYWRGVVAAALLLPIVVLLGPTVPVPLIETTAEQPRSAAAQSDGLAERSDRIATSTDIDRDDGREATDNTLRPAAEWPLCVVRAEDRVRTDARSRTLPPRSAMSTA